MKKTKLGLVWFFVCVGLVSGTQADFGLSMNAFAQEGATSPNFSINCVQQLVNENDQGLNEMSQLRCLVSNPRNRNLSIYDIGTDANAPLQFPIDAMGERSPLSLNSGPLGALPANLRTACIRRNVLDSEDGADVAELRCLNLNTDSGQFTIMDVILSNGNIAQLNDVTQGFLELPGRFSDPGKLQIDCGAVPGSAGQIRNVTRLRCMLIADDTGDFLLFEIEDNRVVERSNLSFFGIGLLGDVMSNLRFGCDAEPVDFDDLTSIVRTPIVLCTVLDAESGIVQMFNLAESTFVVLGQGQQLDLTQIGATPQNIMFSCAAHRTRGGSVGGGTSGLLVRCLAANADTGQFIQADISEEAATPVGEIQTFDFTAIEGEGLPDADGDGVPDVDDLCPNFPGRPIANGC